MNLLWLILQFLWIGSLTFGGGMVAITLLQSVFVDSGILSSTWFYQMLTIAESTPGPIAVNLATYLGFSQAGIGGGFLTTLAFLTPSTVALWLLLPWYQRHHESEKIQALMAWLRPAVLGLIVVTFVAMLQESIDLTTQHLLPSLALIGLTLILLPKMKNRPYVLIAIGAVFGILFF